MGRRLYFAAAVACLIAIGASAASALTVELNDVAADRIERQRAAAEGALPLAGTPDLSAFDERLAERGIKLGSPVFIRAFKAESELELWIMKEGRYVLFAAYPVCQWSGTIGPKVRETDKQTPEGFYTVTRRQLHRSARHPRALNLGFPNAFDKSFARTGSYLLIHGGCSSIGCFAMTDTIIEEIWRVAEAALKEGQEHIPVHSFPFRMTDENMARYPAGEWAAFWTNLKDGYDAFERTKYPPRVSVCEKRYSFTDIAPPEVGDAGPLAVCGETLAAIQKLEQSKPPVPALHLIRSRVHLIQRARLLQASLAVRGAPTVRASRSAVTTVSPTPRAEAPQASRSTSTWCSPTRASCRKFVELQHRLVKSKAAAVAQARVRSARRAEPMRP
jgi:murein L,D-transpeptidase YafK